MKDLPKKSRKVKKHKRTKKDNGTSIIGTRLKRIRKWAGLTMNELRDLTGISPSTISAYEKNKIVPNAKAILLLAKALKVDYNQLLGETNNENVLDGSELVVKYRQLPTNLKVLITQIFELTEAWVKIDELVSNGNSKLLSKKKGKEKG